MVQMDLRHQEIEIYKRMARSTKYVYDVDLDLEYKGYHLKPNADITDDKWWVTKYIYDGNKDLIDKKLDKGAWDNRTGLGW